MKLNNKMDKKGQINYKFLMVILGLLIAYFGLSQTDVLLKILGIAAGGFLIWKGLI